MNNFKTVIRPKTGWRDINLKELWQYRDLIFLYVKRNFTLRYKQTILGPAWLIISPLLNTIISNIVFGKIAEIPSDGVPYFIFFMCGNTAWTYFAYCLNNTSVTFIKNASVFGKVYFPRLVAPVSTVITGLGEFAVNLGMFAAFWAYFKIIGAGITITWTLALLPVLILQMAALGLGCGIIISSLTTKYRDLTVLVSFGVSLWMYVTPVIYSTTTLAPNIRALCMLNPMAPIIEILRYSCLGTGDISWGYWGISLAVTAAILLLGIIMFSKVEKTFNDTV